MAPFALLLVLGQAATASAVPSDRTTTFNVHLSVGGRSTGQVFGTINWPTGSKSFAIPYANLTDLNCSDNRGVYFYIDVSGYWVGQERHNDRCNTTKAFAVSANHSSVIRYINIWLCREGWDKKCTVLSYRNPNI
ncbi:spore coat protein U-like protein [Streptomyces sp. TE12347]